MLSRGVRRNPCSSLTLRAWDAVSARSQQSPLPRSKITVVPFFSNTSHSGRQGARRRAALSHVSSSTMSISGAPPHPRRADRLLVDDPMDEQRARLVEDATDGERDRVVVVAPHRRDPERFGDADEVGIALRESALAAASRGRAVGCRTRRIFECRAFARLARSPRGLRIAPGASETGRRPSETGQRPSEAENGASARCPIRRRTRGRG